MFNCREGVSREGWRRGAVPRKVRRRRTQSTGLGVQPRSRWDQSGDGPGVGDAAAAPDAGAGGQVWRVADGDSRQQFPPSCLDRVWPTAQTPGEGEGSSVPVWPGGER